MLSDQLTSKASNEHRYGGIHSPPYASQSFASVFLETSKAKSLVLDLGVEQNCSTPGVGVAHFCSILRKA